MEASWRSGTRKQYGGTLSKWKWYCGKRKIDPVLPTVADGINFLGTLYEEGIGCSGLNTAQSTLSPIITLPNSISFGNHPRVRQFMKGVYETRPSLPKHQEIWDVRTVLDLLRTLIPVEGLTLKNLTLKLTMLLALVLAQRCQILKALSIHQMKLGNNECIFYFTKLLKTSRSGNHQCPLVIKSSTPNANLCPIQVLH